jgi:hypothetical protein
MILTSVKPYMISIIQFYFGFHICVYLHRSATPETMLQIAEMKVQIDSLKKRVRKLEKEIKPAEKIEETLNGHTLAELDSKIRHMDSSQMQDALKLIVRALFTDEELIERSISGKRSTKGQENNTIRPALDQAKYGALETAMKNKWPEITHKWVTEKTQNVQKVLRRNNAKSKADS